MANEIENHLGRLRQKRGISAADLAKMAGVSRQTVYAMEAGNYTPNTAVALKLARALESTVEELFSLPGEKSSSTLRSEQVTLLPGPAAPHPGQPVELCRVDQRLLASAPSPAPWYFPASDAVVAEPAASGKTRVHLLQQDTEFRNRLLVAGCDPAISVLARHAQAAGAELVLAHRNSSQSLSLLHDGWIHVAGTHLRDEGSGESNLPEIGRLFGRNAVAVITFATWEEGIVTARSNPKSIRAVEDLARPGVTIVNREKGAGARRLLDTRLAALGIRSRKVSGYASEAHGHLAAAWQVYAAAADACIATRAAARLFGLGFVPLASERYDLVIRRRHLDLPGVQTLLDVLSRASVRRALESLGGYDTRATGERLL